MNPFHKIVIGTCDLCEKEGIQIIKDSSKNQWICQECLSGSHVEITFEDVVLEIPVEIRQEKYR